MNNRNDTRKEKEHVCTDHVRYDGGRKVNRDGVRVWIETYYCSVCGRQLDVKEEILD